ncbi:hypothetical protein GCM10027589_13880 [Actinocorallia lasiicapitis]
MSEDQQEHWKAMPPPDGCRWCGVEARTHFQRWKPPVGWHRWEAPSAEQRKERMLARRKVKRNKAGEADFTVRLAI